MPGRMPGGLASKPHCNTSQLCASGKLQLSNVSVPSEAPWSSNLDLHGQISKIEIIQNVRWCIFIIHHILTYVNESVRGNTFLHIKFYHSLHIWLVFLPFPLFSYLSSPFHLSCLLLLFLCLFVFLLFYFIFMLTFSLWGVL